MSNELRGPEYSVRYRQIHSDFGRPHKIAGPQSLDAIPSGRLKNPQEHCQMDDLSLRLLVREMSVTRF